MTRNKNHNVPKDLAFSGPTCPRCGELCPRDSIVCTECGCRLGVDKAELARWMRVRGASITAANINADEHANNIVADIKKRAGAQPWPRRS